MNHRLHIGTFEDEHSLLAAIEACRSRGIEVLDAITPYPIHGIDDALGVSPSRLPWVCLVGGVTGLTLGLWFQYWASWTDWPIDVGGRPFDSLPAFMVVAFETTILFAGLSTVAALFLRSRMWPGRKSGRGSTETADDKLLLVLREQDARFKSGTHEEVLREHGAIEVTVEVEA